LCEIKKTKSDMPIENKPSKKMNTVLWIAQLLLAIGLVFGGIMKLFHPIEELATMWTWTGDVPEQVVRITGIIDLIGAIGLIFPGVIRLPALVPTAAIGVLLLMICASVFHISRGEESQIGVNIVFGVIAAFIAWGRRNLIK
jgi:hypothetical protein